MERGPQIEGRLGQGPRYPHHLQLPGPALLHRLVWGGPTIAAIAVLRKPPLPRWRPCLLSSTTTLPVLPLPQDQSHQPLPGVLPQDPSPTLLGFSAGCLPDLRSSPAQTSTPGLTLSHEAVALGWATTASPRQALAYSWSCLRCRRASSRCFSL